MPHQSEHTNTSNMPRPHALSKGLCTRHDKGSHKQLAQHDTSHMQSSTYMAMQEAEGVWHATNLLIALPLTTLETQKSPEPTAEATRCLSERHRANHRWARVRGDRDTTRPETIHHKTTCATVAYLSSYTIVQGWTDLTCTSHQSKFAGNACALMASHNHKGNPRCPYTPEACAAALS
jgi:hypothetical protein